MTNLLEVFVMLMGGEQQLLPAGLHGSGQESMPSTKLLSLTAPGVCRDSLHTCSAKQI